MDDGTLPYDRPRLLHIDPARCLHGGACRLLAPEIVDPDRIAVTSATLDAMAACPSGALSWIEDAADEDAPAADDPSTDDPTVDDPVENDPTGNDPAAKR